jgi:hypothetical protein
VVPTGTVEDEGDETAHNESPDDHISERAEIVLVRADRAPEASALDKTRLVPDQVDDFETAHDHRYQLPIRP